MLTDWKSESVTDGPTDGRTWVGTRDACASKNSILIVPKARQAKTDYGDKGLQVLQCHSILCPLKAKSSFSSLWFHF